MEIVSQEEWLQAKVLYRQFLLRVFDLELLSAEGDPARLPGQLVTVLFTFSYIVSVPGILILMGGVRRLPMVWACSIRCF